MKTDWMWIKRTMRVCKAQVRLKRQCTVLMLDPMLFNRLLCSISIRTAATDACHHRPLPPEIGLRALLERNKEFAFGL